MVGLNHEMARELLWREYPTDQRGTYFRQFWDLARRVPAPATDAEREALKDIDAIHSWPRGEAARGRPRARQVEARHGSSCSSAGELLKRYPDAVIYAVEGDSPAGRRARPEHAPRRGALPGVPGHARRRTSRSSASS